MTETIITEIAAPDRWTPPRDGVLRDLFLTDVEVAKLPDDRWTRELVMTGGRPQAHNVYPTRAAAIRASVAIAICEARTKHRAARDVYDTNPAFEMNAEQLRVYVAWLRGIVAAEATRKMAAIEKYERGCRRATDWITDQEIEMGIAGMSPGAAAYPARLTAAWAKVVKFQKKLVELRKPVVDTMMSDTIVDRILAAGLAPNRYLLDLNGLYDYDCMNAKDGHIPSRAYGKPFSYVPADRSEDGREHLYIETPYRETPHVARVMAAIGEVVEIRDRDENGARPWHWWHAVDLMSDEHYRHLLDSREFTDDGSIERAVRHALDCPAGWETVAEKKRGRISLSAAREVLAAIGVDEPADRSVEVLLDPAVFRISNDSEGKGKTFNANGRGLSWAYIHGLEDGWLKRDRKGLLVPTDKLIDAQEKTRVAPETTPIEESTAASAWTPPAWIVAGEDDGRPLFAIADEIPDKHVMAWMEERLRRLRIETATLPPFEACIDLGRNLGAAIQIRPTQDGEAWEAAHDCQWGGGGYVVPFRGRYVTRKGAFTVAARAVRAEAQIPIDAVKVKAPMMCIGTEDLRRAERILGWLGSLQPPDDRPVAATMLEAA